MEAEAVEVEVAFEAGVGVGVEAGVAVAEAQAQAQAAAATSRAAAAAVPERERQRERRRLPGRERGGGDIPGTGPSILLPSSSGGGFLGGLWDGSKGTQPSVPSAAVCAAGKGGHSWARGVVRSGRLVRIIIL